MIVIDTSVAIDVIRQRDQKLLDLFAGLRPSFCGIVIAEILQGARNQVDYSKLLEVLQRFETIAIAESIWEVVGRNSFAVRRRGISVPFQDVAIATVAIENQAELWTRDKQFGLIQTALPLLKLFQEPP